MSDQPRTKWIEGVLAWLVLGIWPLTFLGVPAVWNCVDHYHGRREVAAYIAEHEPFVAECRADPRVHECRLEPDPRNSATLIVSVDVEDTSTLERIQRNLPDQPELRFPPSWSVVVRSGEERGTDLGSMAAGIGVAAAGFERLVVAFGAATLASAAVLVCWFFYSDPGEDDAEDEAAAIR